MLFSASRQAGVRFAVLLEKRFALAARKRKSSVARRKRLKKCPAALANPLRPPQQRRRTQLQHPQRLIRVPRQLFKAVIRNLPPEIIAGHILDFVRFVEHHRRIFRQDAAEIVMLQRQIREKQMMIHDDQVGFVRPARASRSGNTR